MSKKKNSVSAILAPLSPRGVTKFKKPNNLLKNNIVINGNIVLPSIRVSNTDSKK